MVLPSSLPYPLRCSSFEARSSLGSQRSGGVCRDAYIQYFRSKFVFVRIPFGHYRILKRKSRT